MKRLFVVGNAVADLTFLVERAPRAGESLLAVAVQRAPGGKGLNQAVAAHRTGAAVVFHAAIGNDAEGTGIRKRLEAEQMHALRMVSCGVATDMSVVIVSRSGENSIVTAAGCTRALDTPQVVAQIADIDAGDTLLMQGNLSLDCTLSVIEHARERGAVVIVNAAPWCWPDTSALERCTGVIANEGEIRDISGIDEPEQAARWLLARGPEWVVVTLGARGALLVRADQAVHLPALPVVAVDTSGAGDVFCGVLAAMLSQAAPLLPAIGCAQRAAALAVERHGTFASIPAAIEMRQMMQAVSSEPSEAACAATGALAAGR
ncbi:ribokinase [Paraburkholderia hospita]|jgi:ribokinase|uniref:ribokinase n=1 Tax=Paraburkholderia hospita TaxID=169430 RepID=UPI0009A6C3E9|nr:ribokinase [Paraburkholderia hospita]AXF05137.1 ribokinase [Paraburkholderia hospita]OUL81997.1 ribokinase [Paraburkholderia hospita]SKD03310.1 ribokinase [Paraburkholderia hospita]SOE83221.1 ribokinase [Burkholderia sp. YR290]